MEIQRADPAARRAAILAICAGGILVLIIVGFCFARPDTPTLIRNAIGDFFVSSPSLTPVAGAVIVLPIIGASVFVYSISNQIIRTKRFPLPGQKVVRNTRVRQGKAAIRYARMLQLLAAMVILICISIPFVLAALVGS